MSNTFRSFRAAVVPPIDRVAFRHGARTMSIPAIGISAWGMVTGVALVKGGMSVSWALILTATVYAGSAQLAVLPLLRAHNPLLAVWATAALVNVRFVIFAAASRSYFGSLPWPQRLVSGYLNGDFGFAMFMRRYGGAAERGNPEQWGFFYGGAIINWVAWQSSSFVGIFLGRLAPTSWGLELAAVFALLAVLIPLAAKFPALVGIVVSGLLAVALSSWPLKTGLFVAIVVGVACAVGTEMILERRAVSEADKVAV